MAKSSLVSSNTYQANRPFTVVQFSNIIKMTSMNYLAGKSQVKTTLCGFKPQKFLDGSHLAPTKTIAGPNALQIPNPMYLTWERLDQILFDAYLALLRRSGVPFHTSNHK